MHGAGRLLNLRMKALKSSQQSPNLCEGQLQKINVFFVLMLVEEKLYWSEITERDTWGYKDVSKGEKSKPAD